MWLTTHEAETSPTIREKFLAATSSDTRRSRSLTGKPARMLRSAWTDAWDEPDAPQPLQSILIANAQRRIHRVAHQADSPARPLVTYSVGQVVGQMNVAMSARDVVRGMVEERLETMERMHGVFAAEE